MPRTAAAARADNGSVKPVNLENRSVKRILQAALDCFAKSGYHAASLKEIAQAAGEFRHQHITEVTHRLQVADANQFGAELMKLSNLDGVALLAPDVPQVKLAINELVRTGVHVVTLFSDVPGSMRGR